MPPFFIFQGSVHMENWYRDQPDLSFNFFIATSSTGWNNEVSAYQGILGAMNSLLLGPRLSVASIF